MVIVLDIAIGYANFTTGGNVEITDIRVTNIVGLAATRTTEVSASFDIDLKKPGDAVTYDYYQK